MISLSRYLTQPASGSSTCSQHLFRNPRAPVGISKYRELLPGTNLKEFLMVFLPIIANNLGKIAAAAATTLGIVGYINRDRIGRWL